MRPALAPIILQTIHDFVDVNYFMTKISEIILKGRKNIVHEYDLSRAQ